MMKSKRKVRKGVAAVEFAVCLPVIILLTCGSIQASSFIFLKQSLHTAAYETARHATLAKTTHKLAISQGANLLAARNITNGRITLNVPDSGKASRGTAIEVRVFAPTARNTFLDGVVVPSRVLQSHVIMVKE